jgi:hypothetical protein
MKEAEEAFKALETAETALNTLIRALMEDGETNDALQVGKIWTLQTTAKEQFEETLSELGYEYQPKEPVDPAKAFGHTGPSR